MSRLATASAVELADLVARREVSAVQVAEAFLAQAERVNPVLNAIVTFNPRVLDEARACDERLARGEAPRPLDGVPFVVKDNIPTRGLRTTFGSLIHEHNVPIEDAVVVERLRAAGGVLIGKTNTPEFATDINTTNKIFGPTRNPADPNVSPGGSSGGTATAVGADMAPIGLGTDLGGSIRIPSAWCGTSGIRPSPGRVPVYPSDYGWDTLVEHVQGPMARTVADVGLMLSVLAGPDDRDPSTLPDQGHDYAAAARTPADLRGCRVAFSTDLDGLVPVDPEVADAVRTAAAAFESMGCIVEEDSFDTSDVKDIIAGTRGFGLVARFADLVDIHGASMAVQLTGQVSDAIRQDLRSVAKAERLRTLYWHKTRSFFEHHDFMITPTVGAPAFRLDQPLPTEVGGRPVGRYYDVFLSAYAFSLVGLPVASIPCGRTRGGLPIGLQIVGRRLREDRVLGAAAAYAAAEPAHFARHAVRIDEAVVLERAIVSPGMRSA